jgi:hypothetical protein
MNKLMLLLISLTVSLSANAFAQTSECDEAKRSCEEVCNKREFPNPDSKILCEKSCLTGSTFCQTQDSKNSCDTFHINCVNTCPQKFGICLEACGSGKFQCLESATDLPIRQRTGVFDPCSEAEKACQAKCVMTNIIKVAGDEYLPLCRAACTNGTLSCGRTILDKQNQFFYACAQKCPDADLNKYDSSFPDADRGSLCLSSCEAGSKYGKAIEK